MSKSPERTQFLADVLTTAVEGGIGYWSTSSNYRWDLRANPASDIGVTLAVEADAVDREDYRLTVTDGEPVWSWGGTMCEMFEVRVTLDNIATGLGIVMRGEAGVAPDYVGRISTASRLNDCGEIDALDADIVVQAAVFGSVIFG